jgi:HK97 family phage major capsid protein
MKTVTQMKQDYAALLAEVEGILDAADEADRQMTAEEKQKYDAGILRLTEMKADIEQRMRLEAVQRPTFGDQPAGDGGEATPGARRQPSAQLDDLDDAAPANAAGTGADEDGPRRIIAAVVPGRNGSPRIEIPRSYGKLMAFKPTPQGQLAAYRSGMWLRATIYGDEGSREWCRRNGVGTRAALSGGVNTAGGALVPEEFERAIIDLREEYGLFRQSCRVTPMGSDTRNVPRRTGGLTAFYVGEGDKGTESDLGWDNVQLVAKKLMVLMRMSSEISDDAIIDMADNAAQEMAYAFAVKEDTVGFTGTGLKTDGGIVGVLVKALQASFSKAKVTASGAANSCDTFSEVTSDHLIDCMAAVPLYAKRGSAWYCGPVALELVFNAIKAAAGGNTGAALENAQRPMFLGYPINVSPAFPDDPTADLSGLAMLAFGNLRLAATLGDRRGIRVALSTEQYWEQDQIGLKATMRHDINVHDLGSTTVKSPLAVLVGN